MKRKGLGEAKQKVALEMWKKGIPFKEIASAIDVTVPTAREYVRLARCETGDTDRKKPPQDVYLWNEWIDTVNVLRKIMGKELFPRYEV